MSHTADIGGRYTETGTLLQLEYARKAAAKGPAGVGIQFGNGVLLAVEKERGSRLTDYSGMHCIRAVSNRFALLISGLVHDGNVIYVLVRDHAKETIKKQKREPREAEIAEVLSHYLTYFTSYTGLRPVGCEFLLSSASGAEGPTIGHAGYSASNDVGSSASDGDVKCSLSHVDPSGALSKCWAYAVGANASTAKTELEKIEDFETLTLDAAAQCAVRVLNLARDQLAEGPFEIEMMYVSKDSHYKQQRISPEKVREYIERYESSISVE